MRKYNKSLKANGVCHCGCGGAIAPVTHRGAKRLYLPNHYPDTYVPKPRRSSEARFFSKVIKTEGCWVWIGAKADGGYGRFFDGNRLVQAHRFSWVLSGREIPEGLYLDHLCKNPPCVNPSHLEAVTHQENLHRASLAKMHCVNGHEYTEQNTRINTKGRRVCRICAQRSQSKYDATQTV